MKKILIILIYFLLTSTLFAGTSGLHTLWPYFKEGKMVRIPSYNSKPFPNELPKTISPIKGILVVDEQSPSGNLSSCVFEGFSEQNVFLKIVSKSLPEKYIFENGGREFLLNKFGLSKEDILKAAKKIT